MATLCASDTFLLLSNGTDIGIVYFSSPSELHLLSVPNFHPVSRGDPTQASLPRKNGSGAAAAGSTGKTVVKDDVTSKNATNYNQQDPKDAVDNGRGEEPTKFGGGGDETLKAKSASIGDDVSSTTTLLPSSSVFGSRLDDPPGDAGDPRSTYQRSDDAQPNFIRAVAISHSGSHVAVCDDRKYLHVFRIDATYSSIVSSRCTARRCTAVCFSPDDKLILVADKSGDVYSFPVTAQGNSGSRLDNKGSGTEHGADGTSSRNGVSQDGGDAENQSEDESGSGDGGSTDGTLVLGHLSMLLGVALVDNGRLLVTCDRDEKIRISHFPDAYDIHAYCLGHTEFVNQIIYEGSSNILLSSSGDCTIRGWALDGSEIFCTDILKNLPGVEVTSANDEEGDNDKHKDLNKNRPSIKEMSYCAACKLLFVAMERSPNIEVYEFKMQQTTSHKQKQGSLDHVTTISQDTHRGATQQEGTLSDSEAFIVGLCIERCVLWVLTQRANKLILSAYTVSKDQEQIKIVEVSQEGRESQILKGLAKHTDFFTAQEDPDNLLHFLWKSTFQDDFKRECNIKRPKPESSRQGKKAKGGKKAKLGGKPDAGGDGQGT